MAADLDRLAESWRSGADQMAAESQQRMAQMAADQQAWLRSLYDGDTDEGPQPKDQSQARGGASRAGWSPASPAGPGPDSGQPLTFEDVRAAEMAEADRIRNLSLQDFAVERERLIRSRTSRGMFG